MTDEEKDIIRELKNIENEYKNRLVPTGELSVYSMARDCRKCIEDLEKENAELKEQVESYRNAVEKCRHIPYIGVGDEVCHTVVEYAQKVDEILFSVEGINYWFERLGK